MERNRDTLKNFPFRWIVVRLKLNNTCKMFSTVAGMKRPDNNH